MFVLLFALLEATGVQPNVVSFAASISACAEDLKRTVEVEDEDIGFGLESTALGFRV